jgi:quercetin dioxygenase-like cupin family protein
MNYQFPHTIKNPIGETLIFKEVVQEPDGDKVLVENYVTPKSGPPMHTHFLQDEALTVVKGRIGYQVQGGQLQYAGEGETIIFKRGTPHRFWNAGKDDLRCTGHIEPADNVEYFLTEMFESAKRNGGGRPDLFDVAFLTTRYRSEYAMVEIPALVQRLMFPLLIAVGRLRGRYRKYADAPEPVRR